MAYEPHHEYAFQHATRRDAQFTANTLDDDELALVKRIVDWDGPAAVAESIYEAHGRSVTLRSPTRRSTLEDTLMGRFDGLQVIGACGSLHFVQNGVFTLPETIVLSPTDPTNHADSLRNIVQLREVNPEGDFEFSYRPYVPLHGMDSGEARNRKHYSEQFSATIQHFRGVNGRLPFVGPMLAAEGVFPQLRDPAGVPLCFQVYRVPTMRRLPGQMLAQVLDSESVAEFQRHVMTVGCYSGNVVRSIHGMRLAYMDAHVGNMSFIADNGRSTLFTTDLGSCKDVAMEPHASKYQALDLFTYLTTSFLFLDKLFDFIRDNLVKNVPSEAIKSDLSSTKYLLTKSLLRGYYHPERKAHESSMHAFLEDVSEEFLYDVTHNRFYEFIDLFGAVAPEPRIIAYQMAN